MTSDVTQAGIFPRIVSHDEALAAAKNFIDAHFNNAGAKGVLTGIPARPEHDDLVLTDYIKQQRAKDRLTAQSGEGDYTEAFDILVDVHDALALTAEYSDGAMVSSFVASSTQFARLRKFLHDRQYADPRSSGEGRSGAGEEVEKLLQLIETAHEHANEIWIVEQAARVRDAIGHLAALNARQSGEGEREAIDCEQLARAMNPPLWSDDEETAHRAASPLQVCYARERAVEEAKVVLIELAALRATDDAGGAAKAPDTGEGE